MTTRLGLPTDIVDDEVHRRSVKRFRELGILLPTFAQLADPARIPGSIRDRLAGIDPDENHPLNLFRVHWFNPAPASRELASLPAHIVLPPSLTGVAATIVVVLGQTFPMIESWFVFAPVGTFHWSVVFDKNDMLSVTTSVLSSSIKNAGGPCTTVLTFASSIKSELTEELKNDGCSAHENVK